MISIYTFGNCVVICGPRTLNDDRGKLSWIQKTQKRTASCLFWHFHLLHATTSVTTQKEEFWVLLIIHMFVYTEEKASESDLKWHLSRRKFYLQKLDNNLEVNVSKLVGFASQMSRNDADAASTPVRYDLFWRKWRKPINIFTPLLFSDGLQFRTLGHRTVKSTSRREHQTRFFMKRGN